MKSIEEHIEYLLREHDCVILPGWGAFIAQFQCARIDGNCIVPPSRSYGFNGALTFSDGLLENSIVRRSRCSYSTAGEQVRDAVAMLKRQIEATGEVAIGRIGIFHRNDDGALIFSPFEQQIVASQFYGFSPLDIPTLQSQSVADEADTDDIIIDDEVSPWRRIGARYMRYAASIIVLLVLTFILSTPLAVNTPSPDFAGINDSFKIHCNEQSVTLADTGANRELAVMLPLQSTHEDVSDIDPIANDITELVSDDFKPGDYCLVVASGRSMHEAEMFGEYHKSSGLTFRIFEVDGKFRVYVATGDNYAELMKVQEELREHFPQSWICKR